MIINDKFKFVFVHTPKVAGTSISAALNALKGKNRAALRGIRTKHVTPADFFQRIAAGPDDIMPGRNGNPIRSYRFFCFVRNPWERFFSLHRYLLGKRPWPFDPPLPSDLDGFAQMLEDRTTWLLNLHSTRPQVDFAADPVSFIGRYEHLQRDLAAIACQLGITLDIGHNNPSGAYKEDYRRYMSSRTVDIIANVYAADIAAFGYDFNGQSPD